MELEKVIERLKNNDLTSKEILGWESEKKFNLWHIFAATNNVECFNKVSGAISKQKLIEKLNEKNELGDLPVHLAAWSGNLEILKSVVKITNTLDVLDAQDRNIAMICFKSKDKDLIDFSLQYTKKLNQQDRHNHNLLQYAQSYSEPAVYQKLLDLGCLPEKKTETVAILNQEKDESILDFVQKNKKSVLN